MKIINTTIAHCCGDGGHFYIVRDDADVSKYKGSCMCGRDQIGVFSVEEPTDLVKKFHPDAIMHKWYGPDKIEVAVTDESSEQGYHWALMDKYHPLFDEFATDLGGVKSRW